MIGHGILNGLGVTIRHFVDTALTAFAVPDQPGRVVRQTPLRTEKGSFTVQYPEERLALPERARCLPMLVVDSETGEPRCTACGICAKVCPPQAIWVVRGRGANGKPVSKPTSFVVEAGVCMGCGLCAEYCPFDSIWMNQVYELSTYASESLVLTMDQLLVSEAYHAKIHPRQHAEREKARREKAAARERAERTKVAVG